MSQKPASTPLKRFILVLAVLIVPAVLTLTSPLLSRPISGAHLARRISLNLGPWTGLERTVDDETKAILQTDDIVDRHYTQPDQPYVDFTVVFAKEQRKVAHPQEICLKGAGFNLQEYDRISIPTSTGNPPSIPVVKLRIEKGNERYLVYYWYKCGDHFTSSYYWENLLIMWSNVTFRPANGALIKVLTPIDPNENEAAQRLQKFIGLLTPEIAQKLQ